MVSISYIHLNCHGCRSDKLSPRANQVADLAVKDLELFKPQQKESFVSVTGSTIPIFSELLDDS